MGKKVKKEGVDNVRVLWRDRSKNLKEEIRVYNKDDKTRHTECISPLHTLMEFTI